MSNWKYTGLLHNKGVPKKKKGGIFFFLSLLFHAGTDAQQIPPEAVCPNEVALRRQKDYS